MSSIDRVHISNPSLDPSYTVQNPVQRPVHNNGEVKVDSSGRPPAVQADSVSLSSTAKDVDRFSALVGRSRQQRLEEVRGMIDAGTYHVSSEDIARKLIESNRK